MENKRFHIDQERFKSLIWESLEPETLTKKVLEAEGEPAPITFEALKKFRQSILMSADEISNVLDQTDGVVGVLPQDKDVQETSEQQRFDRVARNEIRQFFREEIQMLQSMLGKGTKGVTPDQQRNIVPIRSAMNRLTNMPPFHKEDDVKRYFLSLSCVKHLILRGKGPLLTFSTVSAQEEGLQIILSRLRKELTNEKTKEAPVSSEKIEEKRPDQSDSQVQTEKTQLANSPDQAGQDQDDSRLKTNDLPSLEDLQHPPVWLSDKPLDQMSVEELQALLDGRIAALPVDDQKRLSDLWKLQIIENFRHSSVNNLSDHALKREAVQIFTQAVQDFKDIKTSKDIIHLRPFYNARLESNDYICDSPPEGDKVNLVTGYGCLRALEFRRTCINAFTKLHEYGVSLPLVSPSDSQRRFDACAKDAITKNLLREIFTLSVHALPSARPILNDMKRLAHSAIQGAIDTWNFRDEDSVRRFYHGFLNAFHAKDSTEKERFVSYILEKIQKRVQHLETGIQDTTDSEKIFVSLEPESRNLSQQEQSFLLEQINLRIPQVLEDHGFQMEEADDAINDRELLGQVFGEMFRRLAREFTARSPLHPISPSVLRRALLNGAYMFAKKVATTLKNSEALGTEEMYQVRKTVVEYQSRSKEELQDIFTSLDQQTGKVRESMAKGFFADEIELCQSVLTKPPSPDQLTPIVEKVLREIFEEGTDAVKRRIEVALPPQTLRKNVFITLEDLEEIRIDPDLLTAEFWEVLSEDTAMASGTDDPIQLPEQDLASKQGVVVLENLETPIKKRVQAYREGKVIGTLDVDLARLTHFGKAGELADGTSVFAYSYLPTKTEPATENILEGFRQKYEQEFSGLDEENFDKLLKVIRYFGFVFEAFIDAADHGLFTLPKFRAALEQYRASENFEKGCPQFLESFVIFIRNILHQLKAPRSRNRVFNSLEQNCFSMIASLLKETFGPQMDLEELEPVYKKFCETAMTLESQLRKPGKDYYASFNISAIHSVLGWGFAVYEHFVRAEYDRPLIYRNKKDRFHYLVARETCPKFFYGVDRAAHVLLNADGSIIGEVNITAGSETEGNPEMSPQRFDTLAREVIEGLSLGNFGMNSNVENAKRNSGTIVSFLRRFSAFSTEEDVKRFFSHVHLVPREMEEQLRKLFCEKALQYIRKVASLSKPLGSHLSKASVEKVPVGDAPDSVPATSSVTEPVVPPSGDALPEKKNPDVLPVMKSLKVYQSKKEVGTLEVDVANVKQSQRVGALPDGTPVFALLVVRSTYPQEPQFSFQDATRQEKLNALMTSSNPETLRTLGICFYSYFSIVSAILERLDDTSISEDFQHPLYSLARAKAEKKIAIKHGEVISMEGAAAEFLELTELLRSITLQASRSPSSLFNELQGQMLKALPRFFEKLLTVKVDHLALTRFAKVYFDQEPLRMLRSMTDHMSHHLFSACVHYIARSLRTSREYLYSDPPYDGLILHRDVHSRFFYGVDRAAHVVVEIPTENTELKNPLQETTSAPLEAPTVSHSDPVVGDATTTSTPIASTMTSEAISQPDLFPPESVPAAVGDRGEEIKMPVVEDVLIDVEVPSAAPVVVTEPIASRAQASSGTDLPSPSEVPLQTPAPSIPLIEETSLPPGVTPTAEAPSVEKPLLQNDVVDAHPEIHAPSIPAPDASMKPSSPIEQKVRALLNDHAYHKRLAQLGISLDQFAALSEIVTEVVVKVAPQVAPVPEKMQPPTLFAEELDLIEILVLDEVEALALPPQELPRLLKSKGIFMKEHFRGLLERVMQRVNQDCGQQRTADDLRPAVLEQLVHASTDLRLAFRSLSAKMKPVEASHVIPETELQELQENRQWLQRIKSIRKGSDLLEVAQALAFFLESSGITIPPAVIRCMNAVATSLRKSTVVTKTGNDEVLKTLDVFTAARLTKEVGSMWKKLYPQEVSNQEDLLLLAGLLSYYEQLSKSAHLQIDALKQELGSEQMLYRPERRHEIGPELEYASQVARESSQRLEMLREGLRFLKNILQ